MRRVLLVLVLAAGLAGGVLPAVPALAACPPPGGASIPNAEPAPGDLTILGRGWGHGVGMSQHGAQGAARLGCAYPQILSAYYPGTALATRADAPVVVGLFPNSPTDRGAQVLNVGAVSEDVPWRFVPSSGDPEGLPVRQEQGRTWQVKPASDGGYTVHDVTDPDDSDPPEVWRGGDADGRLEVILDNTHTIYLPSKDREYRRGRLDFTPAPEASWMRVRMRLSTTQGYLYGLGEMPPSWPREALAAQAVAGRSYAARRLDLGLRSNCSCHLWDSPSDQVYAGLDYETGGWPAAVDGTSGQILTHEGEIAETYYSSTHGGQSEALEFSAFFPAGRSLPYLKPVDDSAWELASDSDDNGVLRWSQAYSWEQIGEAFGVGTATRVSTPDPKGAGGRIGVPSRGYGGVVVEGTAGSATVSGLDFVQRLGVSRRSERFAVVTGVGGGGSGPGSDPECAPTTDQSGNTVVTRSSGPGRVETAVAVSRDHWQTASDVVLATAGRFPDALAAGALAARLDAPVLLTSESELSPQVAEEIARLGATTAHVLGGSGAVGPRATEALAQRGVAVRRLAGPSRFETAAAAALAAGSSPSGDVALAFGGDWPDAVSAGALSASADRIPTLLTARDALPSATRAALAELDAQRVLIVGGSAVISEGVAAQLRELGYSVARIAGANRWETSLAAVRDGLSRGTPGGRPVILASGAAFPDALSAGGLAARRNGGLLLVPRCDLNQTTATRDYLDDAGFGGGTIVGGTAAVSDRVREQAANLLRR